MNYSIRYALPDDIPFILNGMENTRVLEERPPEQIKASFEDKNKTIKAVENKWVRILEVDGKQAGFLFFRTDLEIMYHDDKVFWVDLIYVDDGFRDRDYGRILYLDAGELAKTFGFPKIIVDVFDANEPSAVFHHEMGFRRIYGIFELPT